MYLFAQLYISVSVCMYVLVHMRKNEKQSKIDKQGIYVYTEYIHV